MSLVCTPGSLVPGRLHFDGEVSLLTGFALVIETRVLQIRFEGVWSWLHLFESWVLYYVVLANGCLGICELILVFLFSLRNEWDPCTESVRQGCGPCRFETRCVFTDRDPLPLHILNFVPFLSGDHTIHVCRLACHLVK